jgi:hypothetical protein
MTFKNKSECINDFNINYTNPKHPIAFCGLNNIYKYYGGLLKVKEIGKLHASVESYLRKSCEFIQHRNRMCKLGLSVIKSLNMREIAIGHFYSEKSN